MDRTPEYYQAVEQYGAGAGYSQAAIRQLQAVQAPRKQPSDFIKCALSVWSTTQQLKDFIRRNRREYAAGRYSDSEADEFEAEVALLVKTCTAGVEQLKRSVLDAQKQLHARQNGATAPAVNEQTLAHLHGVVLLQAEELASASRSFDRLRAARFTQDMHRTVRRPRPGSLGTPVRPFKAKASGKTASASGGAGQEGGQEGGPEGGGGEGTGSSRLEQRLMEQESEQLVAELLSTSHAVRHVERTMAEVATLNQLLSTAVLEQVDLIEQLYTDAVDASKSVSAGNVSLSATVRINRSSRIYIVVLLLVATASLLFYDWFNS